MTTFNVGAYLAWAKIPHGALDINANSDPAMTAASLKRGQRRRPKYVLCEKCWRHFPNGTRIAQHRAECTG